MHYPRTSGARARTPLQPPSTARRRYVRETPLLLAPPGVWVRLMHPRAPDSSPSVSTSQGGAMQCRFTELMRHRVRAALLLIALGRSQRIRRGPAPSAFFAAVLLAGVTACGGWSSPTDAGEGVDSEQRAAHRNGANPPTTPPPFDPQVFQASTDFSGIQGHRGWSYLDSGDGLMSFEAKNNRWQGSEQYLQLSATGGHPGNTSGAVRRWGAPQDGTIRITGNARDLHPGCGTDGVTVSIKKNAAILWRQSISRDNTTGHDFDLTATVVAGDTIDFVIDRGADNGCDTTHFDPTITLTPSASEPPPPNPPATRKFGVHTNMMDMTTGWDPTFISVQQRVANLKTMGAQFAREGIRWETVETFKGQRNWQKHDEVINALVAEGIEPLVVLSEAPDWANGSVQATGKYHPGYVPLDESKFIYWLNEYRAFAREAATRYRDRVKLWELWNEPNIYWVPRANIDQYVRWASAIEEEIKAVDPGARVAWGSLTIIDAVPPWIDPAESITGKDFLSGIYARGARPEIISIHPYPDRFSDPPDRWQANNGVNEFRDVEIVRQIMQGLGQGDRELWFTEFGWSTDQGITEEQKAANLSRSLEIVRDEWTNVTLATWFMDYHPAFTGYALVTLDSRLTAAGKAFQSFMKVGASVQTFSYSDDFSSAQGNRGWYYLDSTGAQMQWDAAQQRWQGGEAHLQLFSWGGHPGQGRDAVARWVAPRAGIVKISGLVNDSHAGCGADGVVFRIAADGTVLQSIALGRDDSAGKTFDVATSIGQGQSIDFALSKGTDNGCDTTAFNPTIVLAAG